MLSEYVFTIGNLFQRLHDAITLCRVVQLPHYPDAYCYYYDTILYFRKWLLHQVHIKRNCTTAPWLSSISSKLGFRYLMQMESQFKQKIFLIVTRNYLFYHYGLCSFICRLIWKCHSVSHYSYRSFILLLYCTFHLYWKSEVMGFDLQFSFPLTSQK